MKNLILIFIILGIASCNTRKIGKPTATVDKNEILFHSQISSKEPSLIANYESEDFVSNALNNYSIATINKEYRFLKCTKESVVNIHDPSIIDTIYTFSNSENKIQIYRSKQKDIIFTFDVTDSRLVLAGNVKTGINEDLFSRKFNIAKTIN